MTTDGFVTTADGTRLYTKDWGRGRPVILVHGWPLSADSWDVQALALAEAGFRAIAYDRRGFGRSSQPWEGYDYDTLADDLAAVIEQTGARDAVLVGFSMGGGEVARYMSRHAGGAAVKAALIGSVLPYKLQAPDNPDGVPLEKVAETAAAIRRDRAGFFGKFFNDFFGVGGPGQTVNAETLKWAWTVAMQASLKATLGCQQAFSTTDFRPDLPAFRGPTLIIHGTEDKNVPVANAERTAQGIRGAQFLPYAGAPHGLFATDAERLNQDLLDFIRS